MADKLRFVVYRDAKQEYRWRLVASNGNIIADSGEGYVERRDCMVGIDLVKGADRTTAVEDQTRG